MRKILKEFDNVWSEAETVNRKSGRRFERCFNQSGKYVSFGIYDTQSKRYELFDTINLSGNFRYNSGTVPPELKEMRELVNE